ncbi:MAG: hypothetical protein NXI24_04650 [bacterium]|nr:hypothetical protein [bacterium]
MKQQSVDRHSVSPRRRPLTHALIAGVTILITTLVCVSCAQNSRIIRQTPDSAIIAGEGDSRIEAEFAAMERAQELFAEFHQTREMECSQEYRGGSTNAHLYPAAGHLAAESRAYTYWQCVVFTAPGPSLLPDAAGASE